MDLNPAILHAYDKNRDKNSFRCSLPDLNAAFHTKNRHE